VIKPQYYVLFINLIDLEISDENRYKKLSQKASPRKKVMKREGGLEPPKNRYLHSHCTIAHHSNHWQSAASAGDRRSRWATPALH
jgi:hypothetical protein